MQDKWSLAGLRVPFCQSGPRLTVALRLYHVASYVSPVVAVPLSRRGTRVAVEGQRFSLKQAKLEWHTLTSHSKSLVLASPAARRGAGRCLVQPGRRGGRVWGAALCADSTALFR